MTWNRWSLMGFFLTRMAKAQGFLDPRVLFGQLQRFARPSEVWVPSELLRSGMTLQARGVLNSQAIQHNLDWIWPFWVYHQFNPHDPAFLPRAFNLSHINLTHRNWTALGVPDYADYPLVDPRGLVTPFFDGWSLDAWIIAENGASLIPAQMPYVHQQLNLDGLRVLTSSTSEGMYLRSQAEVIVDQSIPKCVVCYQALTSSQAWLLVCVRPFNTEGVSFVHDLDRLSDEEGWLVNGEHNVRLRLPPQSYAFSNYHDGDIARPGPSPREQVAIATDKIHCPVGMATAAALYALSPHQNFEVTVEVPLSKAPVRTTLWKEHLHNYCRIEVPDQSFQCLYETALRTLILHSPGDVYQGPFTYKRFWFRDAAFILDAMLATGLMKNMEAIVHAFPKRQTPLGYFKSQDG